MKKRTRPKRELHSVRTLVEQSRRETKRVLERAVRDQRKIVALSRQLQRAEERTRHALVELHAWLGHKLNRQSGEDVRQTGTEG